MPQSYKIGFSLFVLVTGLGLGLFFKKQQKNELSLNGAETIGNIIKINGLTKTYITYQFSDGLSVYTKKKRVYTKFLKKHRLGDTVTIIYSLNDPNVSRIKYND